jgi:hypothetical protein
MYMNFFRTHEEWTKRSDKKEAAQEKAASYACVLLAAGVFKKQPAGYRLQIHSILVPRWF